MELLKRIIENKKWYLEQLFSLANGSKLKIQKYEIIEKGNVKHYNAYNFDFYLIDNKSFNDLVKSNFNRTKIFNVFNGVFEIVFDIDNLVSNANLKECIEYVKQIINELEKNEIKNYYIWSSGHWFHIHVFFEIKEEFLNEILNYRFKYLEKGFDFEQILKEIIINTFLQIFQIPKNEKFCIELEQLKSFDKWIRGEGSQNEKTLCFKSFIENIENFKLINKFEDVKFPMSIKTNWCFWMPLILNELENKLKELENPKIQIEIKTKSKKRWIEELLKTQLSDGRKRAINLILAPYLVNELNLNENEALNIVLNWLNECNKLRQCDIKQNHILYQLRYAKKNKLKPLTLKKALQFLNDVKEFEKFKNFKTESLGSKLNEIIEILKKDITKIKEYDEFLTKLYEKCFNAIILRPLPFKLKYILYLICKNKYFDNSLKLLNELIVNYRTFNRIVYDIITLEDVHIIKASNLNKILFKYSKSYINEFLNEMRKRQISIFLKIIKSLGDNEFSKKDIINKYVSLKNEKEQKAKQILKPILNFLTKHGYIEKIEKDKYKISKNEWFNDFEKLKKLNDMIYAIYFRKI